MRELDVSLLSKETEIDAAWQGTADRFELCQKANECSVLASFVRDWFKAYPEAPLDEGKQR